MEGGREIGRKEEKYEMWDSSEAKQCLGKKSGVTRPWENPRGGSLEVSEKYSAKHISIDREERKYTGRKQKASEIHEKWWAFSKWTWREEKIIWKKCLVLLKWANRGICRCLQTVKGHACTFRNANLEFSAENCIYKDLWFL